VEHGRWSSQGAQFGSDSNNAPIVVVLIGDKVLVADLFASRRLFERLWGKLLDSYIVEAARRSQDAPASKADSAREFIEMAAKSEILTAATAGAGRGIELKTAKITGHGLALGAAPVHLALFPAEEGSRTERSAPLQRQYSQTNQAVR
jgi:hypothetical protein